MRPAAALLTACLVLAGCLEPSDPKGDAGDAGGRLAAQGSAQQEEGRSRSGGGDFEGGEADVPGPQQPAPNGTPQPQSPPVGIPLGVRYGEDTVWNATCPCGPWVLSVPKHEKGYLEVRIAWDGTQVADFGLEVNGRGGQRGFDARRVLFEAPAGRYDVAVNGTGVIHGLARLGPVATDGYPPNLVTLAPSDPSVGSCDAVESVEQGARKCLRLGNAVGNTGLGPLQVVLEPASGPAGLIGQGRFVQQVLGMDGEMHGHEVGPASFHASHTHWHYDGLATFSLFPVDGDGLRGPVAASHRKAGFCFADVSRMQGQPDVPDGEDSGFTGLECLVPGLGGWRMGVSPGWYDFYPSSLTDQYIDIQGVPDGLYEMVSAADTEGTLEETDDGDNAASLLLNIRGNDIGVVERRAFHRLHEEYQDE